MPRGRCRSDPRFGLSSALGGRSALWMGASSDMLLSIAMGDDQVRAVSTHSTPHCWISRVLRAGRQIAFSAAPNASRGVESPNSPDFLRGGRMHLVPEVPGGLRVQPELRTRAKGSHDLCDPDAARRLRVFRQLRRFSVGCRRRIRVLPGNSELSLCRSRKWAGGTARVGQLASSLEQSSARWQEREARRCLAGAKSLTAIPKCPEGARTRRRGFESAAIR